MGYLGRIVDLDLPWMNRIVSNYAAKIQGLLNQYWQSLAY